MAEFKASIYFVTIPAANASNCDVSRFFEIGEYCLRASLCDPYGVGDIANTRIGVATQVNKNVSVVREESPLTANF